MGWGGVVPVAQIKFPFKRKACQVGRGRGQGRVGLGVG